MKKWFAKNGEAEYCPRVQDGEITVEEFEEDGCADCVYDCEIADTIEEYMEQSQDEEGNWGNRDDLDDNEIDGI